MLKNLLTTYDCKSAGTPNGGRAYPALQRLGHFLTADCKSAGTPNGGKGISGATDSQQQAQDQALRQAHQGSPEGRDQPLGRG